MSIFFPPYQEYVFLLMSAVGFLLGVAYDALKIKRKLFGTAIILLFIDDFLFMVFSSAVFLFSIFAFNNGIYRWYEAFFCLLGFVVYRYTLSKVVMIVFEFIIGIIHSFLRLLLKAILIPMKRGYRLVAVMFSPLNNYIIYISEIVYIYGWIKKSIRIGK